MQLADALRQSFPELSVSGGPHPLGPTKALVVQSLALAQYGAIAGVWAGEQYIFPALGMPVPPWFMQATQNKFGTTMAIWFLGNTVIGNMSNSGAFEVYYAGPGVEGPGTLVWSKLETGNAPHTQRVLHAVMQAAAREGKPVSRAQPAHASRAQ